jgi:hypothetical protein
LEFPFIGESDSFLFGDDFGHRYPFDTRF